MSTPDQEDLKIRLSELIQQHRDLDAAIEEMIARLDEKLSDQMNAILHHPTFQQLESSWRGLNHFVMNSPII